MRIGFCGLGRMGMNMVARIQQGGHEVVAWNRTKSKKETLLQTGARWADTIEQLVAELAPPRAIWVMVPAESVDEMLDQIVPLCEPDDIIIDGGNCRHGDTAQRSRRLAEHGIHLLDAGTSGGIWGLQVGYCLMVGGEVAAYERLVPILSALAPPDGFLHVGPSGAGHFVKMVHNGIEYGMMQAYAEGFELLQASEYSPNLPAVAHLWNQGSVVRSWLLELAEHALAKDPQLEAIRGSVQDSGEGRWMVHDAVDLAVPAPVIALSLFSRFASRQTDAFSNRLLAALRREFGGHAVEECQR